MPTYNYLALTRDNPNRKSRSEYSPVNFEKKPSKSRASAVPISCMNVCALGQNHSSDHTSAFPIK